MQTILTIAGFDPSGGAGILADVKAFAAFGCYGLAAITSVTSQNTLGVFSTYHQSAAVLHAQLQPLVEDFEIAALKIGMLPTKELVEVVVALLAQKTWSNVVLDPVLQSSSGYALMEEEAQSLLLEKLLPCVDLITPNLQEAAALGGGPINSVAEMKSAAQALSQRFSQEQPVAVLVKGGHLEDEATDVLFDGRELHTFTSQKIISRQTHGTGCTLSSAIAALLAQNVNLAQAVKRAKEYITEAITQAPHLGRGAGPLNHFYYYVPQQPNG